MAALNLHFETYLTNPGGLDSRDQSRSRSRTSLASRLTFLKCRDVGFWNVEIESLDRDKNKNRDKLRLYSIEIVEICRDVIFQTVKKISTVEMSFFKLSRKSRPSTPALCKCQDRESRSRHDRDKSRPPGLVYYNSQHVNYHFCSTRDFVFSSRRLAAEGWKQTEDRPSLQLPRKWFFVKIRFPAKNRNKRKTNSYKLQPNYHNP